MPAFADLMRQIDEKNATASSLIESWSGVPSRAQQDEIKKLNAEIRELETQAADTKEGDSIREEIAARKARMNQPAQRHAYPDGSLPDAEGKSGGARVKLGPGETWGERFISDPAIKDWRKRLMPNGQPPTTGMHVESPALQLEGVRLKDLITGNSATSAGAMVTPDYYGLVALPRRPLGLRDVITTLRTSSDSVSFPRVTSYTNNAAPVVEATATAGGSGVKPESALALARDTVDIKTIANWIAITRRALADAPLIESLITEFLLYNLDEEVEDQIAVGDGAGENFDGIFHVSGTTAQAWDTDFFTTTRKALTKAKVVGRAARVNAWLMNPYDVQAMDLLYNNEKNFYMGGPTGGISNQRLWGLPIIENEAVTQGYAAVGDFKTVVLFDREQANIRMTDSHSDFFIRNLIAMLAELRAGLGYLRPAALVIVDVAA